MMPSKTQHNWEEHAWCGLLIAFRPPDLSRTPPSVIRIVGPLERFIFRMYDILTVQSFEATNDKMSSCHTLEMIDKG